MTTPYAAASVATPAAQLSQFGSFSTSPLNNSNIAQAVAAAAGKQIEGKFNDIIVKS